MINHQLNCLSSRSFRVYRIDDDDDGEWDCVFDLFGQVSVTLSLSWLFVPSPCGSIFHLIERQDRHRDRREKEGTSHAALTIWYRSISDGLVFQIGATHFRYAIQPRESIVSTGANAHSAVLSFFLSFSLFFFLSLSTWSIHLCTHGLTL